MPYANKEQQKKAQHESYLRNKAVVKERNRLRRLERRAWFDEYLSDKSCVFCDEDENVCLDHHHINPEEKLTEVSRLLTNLRSKKSIMEEAAKCIIICTNCHRKLHAGIISL